MKITEKAAYLKGLCEGMKLDAESNEGKLLLAVVDLLGDMAREIEDLNENAMDLAEEIDQISDDLADVEEFLDEECEDEDEDCCCKDDEDCCCCDDEDDESDDEPVFYEVTCPKCGANISVDEEILNYDSFKCPKCGESLEFEFDEDDGGEECCCDCDAKE